MFVHKYFVTQGNTLSFILLLANHKPNSYLTALLPYLSVRLLTVTYAPISPKLVLEAITYLPEHKYATHLTHVKPEVRRADILCPSHWTGILKPILLRI
jgi:hypothetical protein